MRDNLCMDPGLWRLVRARKKHLIAVLKNENRDLVAHALLACTLLLFIADNLFPAFIKNNLKPQARAGRTGKCWAGLIAAELAVAFHRKPKPT